MGPLVRIAAPLIALIYVFGTNAVLAYISPARVDLAATVPQLIQVAGGGGPEQHCDEVVIAPHMESLVKGASIYIATAARR